jgi:hypothetical protein
MVVTGAQLGRFGHEAGASVAAEQTLIVMHRAACTTVEQAFLGLTNHRMILQEL